MVEKNKIIEKEGYLVYFRIGGHLIETYWPKHLDFRESLPTFMAFLEAEPLECEAIMSVEIQTGPLTDNARERTLLSDVSIHWGDRFRFEEAEHVYITSVQGENTLGLWTMHSSKDFKRSAIQVVESELLENSVLSWLLMMVYGQAVLPHRSMLIHASVIETGTRGFAFLGKSGTGKSTHSRLWMEHIRHARLLNDDNPVVSLDSQQSVWIYGSPWSGKTACYRNYRVLLGGMVRLKQAKANRWTEMSAKDALLSVLPSCTSIRWNKTLFSRMVDTVEEVVRNVPVAYLECLPNDEAAYLCYQKLKDTNDNQTT